MSAIDDAREATTELWDALPVSLPTPPDILDRLMVLWQEPWSEAAFGEAQMLLSQLRAALPAPSPSGDVDAAWTLRVKGRTHTLGCQFAHVHSWPECFDDGVALRASTVTPGLDVERLLGETETLPEDAPVVGMGGQMYEAGWRERAQAIRARLSSSDTDPRDDGVHPTDLSSGA